MRVNIRAEADAATVVPTVRVHDRLLPDPTVAQVETAPATR